MWQGRTPAWGLVNSSCRISAVAALLLSLLSVRRDAASAPADVVSNSSPAPGRLLMWPCALHLPQLETPGTAAAPSCVAESNGLRRGASQAQAAGKAWAAFRGAAVQCRCIIICLT